MISNVYRGEVKHLDKFLKIFSIVIPVVAAVVKFFIEFRKLIPA